MVIFKLTSTLMLAYQGMFLISKCLSATCNNAYSCALSSIIESSAETDCRGYNSCRQCSQISSSAGGEIKCSGAFSCYKSSNVIDSSGTTDLIHCYGLFSCALIDNIYVVIGYIACYGELSCFGSILDFQSTSNFDNIYCYGDKSCAEATIYSEWQIWIGAHLGAQNTIFYNDNWGVNYYFYGVNSGNGAEIICQTDDYCYVHCYTNACFNLKLTCNDCISMNVYCYGEAIGICSYDNYIEYLDGNTDYTISVWEAYNATEWYYQLPDLSNKDLSTYSNSFAACYSDATNAINCDDYQDSECYGNILNTSIIRAPICCTATESCKGSLINSKIALDESDDGFNSLIESTAIRCDGYYSCDDAQLISGELSGGNIYLTAYQACGDSDNSFTVATTNYYDIICSGYFSCGYLTLKNSNNLYCTGQQSCLSAALIENINNIYAYGYQSLNSVDEIKNIKNIYCGYQGCNGGTNINNVTNIFCLGYSSCEDIKINGVSNVYAFGNKALSSSTIISSLRNNSNNNANNTGYLTIKIRGESENTFDVYCNETDICAIDCDSNRACRYLYLHCYGECFVRCDEDNGIECPLGGLFPYWQTTNDPQTISTSIPTNIPTEIPTKMPTDIPSTEPTSVPTGNPTNIPSRHPSTHPITDPSLQPSTEPTMYHVTNGTALSINGTTTAGSVSSTSPTSNSKNVSTTLTGTSSEPNATSATDAVESTRYTKFASTTRTTSLKSLSSIDTSSIQNTDNDDGETNNDIDNNDGFSEQSLAILMICLTVIIVLLAIIVFCSLREKRQTRKQIELAKIQAMNNNNNNNNNNTYNNNNNTNNNSRVGHGAQTFQSIHSIDTAASSGNNSVVGKVMTPKITYNDENETNINVLLSMAGEQTNGNGNGHGIGHKQNDDQDIELYGDGFDENEHETGTFQTNSPK